MDNSKNLTNTQNQPLTPPSGPRPLPPNPPAPHPSAATPRPPMPAISAAPSPSPAPKAAPVNFTAAPKTTPPNPAAAPSPASPLNAAHSAAPSVAPPNPAASLAPNPNPSQNLDSTQPAAEPSSKTGKKLSKKTLYIIIAIVAAVIAIGAAVACVLILQNQNSTTEVSRTPVVVEEEPTEKTPLADLDKDGLLSAFDEMYVEGYAPEDFLDATILDASANGLLLADSYASIDDLADFEFYADPYEADVTETDNGYAIITAVGSNSRPATNQPIYIAFDETYLSYSSAESDESDPSTIPVVINNTSEDFLAVALPILSVAYSQFAPVTIYDYNFDTTSNLATLDLYFIDLGIEETEDDAVASTNSSSSSDSSSSSTTSTSSSSSTNSSTGSNTSSSTSSDTSSSMGGSSERTSDSASSDSPYFIEATHAQLTVNLKTGAVSYRLFDDSIFEPISLYSLSEDEFTDRYEIYSDLTSTQLSA